MHILAHIQTHTHTVTFVDIVLFPFAISPIFRLLHYELMSVILALYSHSVLILCVLFALQCSFIVLLSPSPSSSFSLHMDAFITVVVVVDAIISGYVLFIGRHGFRGKLYCYIIHIHLGLKSSIDQYPIPCTYIQC